MEELRRTDTALLAVQGVYREYVRGELRQRAMSARELVETVDRATAALAVDEAAARHAAEASAQTNRKVVDLEADERRLRQEIDGLRASSAYRDAQALHDLQAHVATLAQAVERATNQLKRRSDAAAEARLSLVDAIGGAEQDRQSLAGDLKQLAEAMGHASLARGAPDAPALSLEQVDAGDLELHAPVEALAGGATRRALQEIRGAVLARATRSLRCSPPWSTTAPGPARRWRPHWVSATIRVAEHADGVDTAALTRLLDSVSTDPEVLGSPAGPVVVTTDGRFRIGVLLGRHAKARADLAATGDPRVRSGSRRRLRRYPAGAAPRACTSRPTTRRSARSTAPSER